MTQLVLIKMEKSLKTLGIQHTGIISEIYVTSVAINHNGCPESIRFH